LARVLAHRRRIEAHAEAAAVEGNREERRLDRLPRALAIRQTNVGQTAGRREMRIVVEILGTAYRREGQADALEQARKLVGAVRLEPLAEVAQQRRPRLHALVVRREGRIGLEIVEAERVAERGPLRIAHDRQED